jgi:hypothetical protein
VFSPMTSFTVGPKTSFTPETVFLGGNADEVGSEGQKRTADRICDSIP